MRVGNLLYCTYAKQHYLIIAEITHEGQEAWQLLTEDGTLDYIWRGRQSQYWKVVS